VPQFFLALFRLVCLGVLWWLPRAYCGASGCARILLLKVFAVDGNLEATYAARGSPPQLCTVIYRARFAPPLCSCRCHSLSLIEPRCSAAALCSLTVMHRLAGLCFWDGIPRNGAAALHLRVTPLCCAEAPCSDVVVLVALFLSPPRAATVLGICWDFF
jgi:hypothetical protein